VPELQSRRDVVIRFGIKNLLFILLGEYWDIIAVGSLRQLEEVRPVYTAIGAATYEIRMMLPEYRSLRTGLDARARIRYPRNTPIITGGAYKV
jgi:hypothetical protein